MNALEIKEDYCLNCSNCGHEQSVGMFCSICGNKLGEPILNTEPIASRTRSVKPNVHVESIKSKLKTYSSYLIQRLKKPSLAYNQGENEFTSSIVSIILFTVLFTLSLFLLTKNLSSSHSPNFLSFFMEAFLLTFFLIGIVLLSIFLISNFFGPQHTFKAIICFYGGQLSLLIIGLTGSILLMLVESVTYGNALLTICLVFGIFILPLYVMGFLLTKNQSGIDPLYGFMLYIVTFIILFILFLTIVGDSKIGGYFNHMNYLF